MGSERGLIVRRTARHDLVLPVTLRIDDDYAEMVRFGPRAGDHDGWINADLMDIGLAGAGVVSQNFLPRGTRVRLKILSMNPENKQTLLECTASVVRVVMTDRRPAYMLGLAFQDLDEDEAETVKAFIDEFVDPVAREATERELEGGA